MSKKNVDNLQQRHKCSICGKVRFEKFMKKLDEKTRYGFECWSCADQQDEEHNQSNFNAY